MTVGSWNYNISTVSMPPHIADAFDMLCDVVGAGYSFIAYLGS